MRHGRPVLKALHCVSTQSLTPSVCHCLLDIKLFLLILILLSYTHRPTFLPLLSHFPTPDLSLPSQAEEWLSKIHPQTVSINVTRQAASIVLQAADDLVLKFIDEGKRGRGEEEGGKGKDRAADEVLRLPVVLIKLVVTYSVML
jgi:hypothetical protein